jgi:hypothetical protein
MSFSHELRRLTLGLQDAPLLDWAGQGKGDPGFRDEYLAEMLRLEGRGNGQLQGCMSCSSAEGLYRCEDCLGGILECRSCCLQRHRYLPLHIIQVRVALLLDDLVLTHVAMEPDFLPKNNTEGSGATCATWAYGFPLPGSEARSQGLYSPSYKRLTLRRGRFLWL